MLQSINKFLSENDSDYPSVAYGASFPCREAYYNWKPLAVDDPCIFPQSHKFIDKNVKTE